MNYKKIYEYYHSIGIATKQEREQLNAIENLDAFAQTFERYTRKWKYLKAIRHNRFNKEVLTQSAKDAANMREFLLSRPELITDRLEGQTEAEKERIRSLDKPYYEQYGIGAYYDDIYNQN